MLRVAELKAISQDRLEDANVLLGRSRLDGALYLCGYAVELGLKARICLTLGWDGFPETKSEFEGLQSLKTHDLEILLKLSGYERQVKTGHLGAWSVILSWDPSKRYTRSGDATAQEAAHMVRAAEELVGAL